MPQKKTRFAPGTKKGDGGTKPKRKRTRKPTTKKRTNSRPVAAQAPAKQKATDLIRADDADKVKKVKSHIEYCNELTEAYKTKHEEVKKLSNYLKDIVKNMSSIPIGETDIKQFINRFSEVPIPDNVNRRKSNLATKKKEQKQMLSNASKKYTKIKDKMRKLKTTQSKLVTKDVPLPTREKYKFSPLDGKFEMVTQPEKVNVINQPERVNVLNKPEGINVLKNDFVDIGVTSTEIIENWISQGFDEEDKQERRDAIELAKKPSVEGGAGYTEDRIVELLQDKGGIGGLWSNKGQKSTTWGPPETHTYRVELSDMSKKILKKNTLELKDKPLIGLEEDLKMINERLSNLTEENFIDDLKSEITYYENALNSEEFDIETKRIYENYKKTTQEKLNLIEMDPVKLSYVFEEDKMMHRKMRIEINKEIKIRESASSRNNSGNVEAANGINAVVNARRRKRRKCCYKCEKKKT